MKDVKDLTDLEFGNLLKECCERLEMESKECVRIKDTFFSYFMLRLDNDGDNPMSGKDILQIYLTEKQNP